MAERIMTEHQQQQYSSNRENRTTKDLIDSIVSKDFSEAKETLTSLLTRKSLDAIDQKRSEVAGNFFTHQ
jgi:hypothetical protein